MWNSYSSFRAHLRLVRAPCFLRVSVSSMYSLSASGKAIPSHTRMSTTSTAVSHVWPARSRTRQSNFSSTQLRRSTCQQQKEIMIESSTHLV